MNNDVKGRLTDCFAVVFPAIPLGELPALTLSSCAEWDSLATVTLLAAIEEEFEVRFGLDEVELMLSFDIIAGMLAGKLEGEG